MKLAAIIMLVFSITLYGCSLQQEVSSLDLRLSLMEKRTITIENSDVISEREIARLKSDMSGYIEGNVENDQKIRNRTAGLYAALGKLREEIQILSGKLEETDHLLKQKISAIENSEKNREEGKKKIEAIANVNRDRIVSLEHYLNFEIADKLETKISSESLEKELLSEVEIYTLAKKAFDQRDFEIARQGFQKVIKRFPKSMHADNAQFWIGEIYYREKWYEKAILEYQKVIEKYPKGNKVPASLLKQGLSFSNLRDKANARLILKELVKKYPKSNEADIARKKIKELK